MILYICILFISLLIVFILNVFLGKLNMSVLQIFLQVYLNAIIIFAMDAIITTLIHKLPQKWFNPNKKIFKVYKFERKFYNIIRVKSWKNKIPELGQLCGFKKNQINDNSPAYLYKFLVETCYAEVIHIACILIGFLDLIIAPIPIILQITLPLALINLLLNILPIFVQRYNRPKLMAYYKRQTKTQIQSINHDIAA